MRRFNLTGYRWYSIDPSINNIGWSSWVGKELTTYGVFETSGESVEDRINSIGSWVGYFKKKSDIDFIVIERPAYFTRVNQHKKSLNVESVMKLSFAYGAIIGAVTPYYSFNLTPKEWKDNAGKEQTKRLVESVFGLQIKNNNTTDAIGLGLFFTKQVKLFNMNESLVKGRLLEQLTWCSEGDLNA